MTTTILIIAANPLSTARLQLDKEIRGIIDGLNRSPNSHTFEVRYAMATRFTDLRRALLDYKPNIVHFCGHGEGENGILLENDNNTFQLVSSKVLAELFKLFSKYIDCVILNACYSSVQANAISKHIHVVIGMKSTLTDEAALDFSIALYDGVFSGKTYQFAFELACNALRSTKSPECTVPELFINESIPNKPNTKHNFKLQNWLIALATYVILIIVMNQYTLL